MPDAFRFYMRCLDVDGTGYYYPNWNRAVPIAVVAATQADALEKAQAMSGQPPRRGFVWRFVVDRIEEVASNA